MSDPESEYPNWEYNGNFIEAWQRVSPTMLRKKIIRRWNRKYVGIENITAAKSLLGSLITTYGNVTEGDINMDASGMWECEISFKEAEWVDPPAYKSG